MSHFNLINKNIRKIFPKKKKTGLGEREVEGASILKGKKMR